MTAAIQIEGVTRRYGRQTVLDDLSLTVPGGIYALLGPNGAGKTTLIELLTTLSTPDAGRIHVAGLDTVHERRHVRRAIGVTGQSASVDDLLTGAENLRLFARLLGLDRRSARRRSEELLERFELSAAAGKKVGQYSGGMRRRLDLAVSLIVAPSVLFLDEPTTGLDPHSRQRLWQDISELAADGTTVFLTTQYLDEADALAERIALLSGGKIVAEGTAAELKARAGEEYLELRDADGLLVRRETTDGSAAHLAAVLATLPEELRGLRVDLRRPTLDDVFTTLTGSGTGTAHAASETAPHRIGESA